MEYLFLKVYFRKPKINQLGLFVLHSLEDFVFMISGGFASIQ